MNNGVDERPYFCFFLNLYQNDLSAAPDHNNKNDAYDAWNRIKNSIKEFLKFSVSIKEF